MFKTSAAALLATTLLAGTAFAQTTPAATAPSPAPMGASATPAMSGQFITDQGTGEYRASKFVGLSIYGPDNARVGDINEVLLDGSGQAKAIVIGVGGFLGIGEKNVAVPFSAVRWVNTRPDTAAATTGSTTATTAGGAPAAAPMAGGTNAMTTSPAASRSPAEQAAANGYPDHGTITLTKADLQNAPTFKYYGDTHAASGATSNATPPTAKP